ncbi:MAG: trigger factor [Proteobacteria bacterium]|nr:trigger factor [Pseudomonadota bacterium]
MEIQKQSHENLVYTFLLTIDKNAIDQNVTLFLQQKSKTYKKPGFRPGKVPMNILEKEFGEQFRADSIHHEIQAGVDKILKENPLKLIRQPQIVSENILENGKIELQIRFEEMPQFELKDLSDLKLRKLVTNITEVDVENFISKMRRLSGKFEVVDRAIQESDFVTVKFTMTKDGKVVNDLEKVEDRIDMTDPAFEHKTVSSKLKGEKVGSIINVNQNYKHVDGDDKKVDIAYEVLTVEACTPSDVDEAFFKNAGVQNLEELRSAFNESLKNASERMSFLYLKRQLLDQLSQQYEFDVPTTIVEEEEKNIRKKIESERFEEIADGITDDDVRTLSLRRIQLGLVIGKIATEHKITVPNELLIRAMVNMASKNGSQNPAAQIKEWAKNPGILDYFRNQLIEGVVVDHLIKTTVSETVTVPIKEFYEEISEYLPDELYDLDSFEHDMDDDFENDFEEDEETSVA